MGDTTSTRRGVLCSLTGLTAISLLPATAGNVGSGRTRLQPSQTTPTFIPAEDDLLRIEETSIGWGIEATSGQFVKTEQAARTPTNRATAYATVPEQRTGEFTQTAVIGTPFTVVTDETVDLTVAFDGRYKGALQAGMDSSVTTSMVYGVGPYETVYGAALGFDTSPTFSTDTIHERKLFDQAVQDGTAIVRSATVRESVLLSTSETTTYAAYARLRTSGEASASDTTTIDFSPDGPELIESRDSQQDQDQYKGFVLDDVQITA
ncbi:hypothetical protein [Halocatena salina]|uniref:Uncharacterized protein n=1 Tax=Halocatena salina TaxID=2934340 RepID=A0A8U0A2M4_9EURY|nr:hypothetical protein [Halocatena salina]UPM43400.1 hypothetical protein MW046_02890 [Halocatena salina]